MSYNVSNISSNNLSIQIGNEKGAVGSFFNSKSNDPDAKIAQIRNHVFTALRCQIPITTLFRPELKIDLGVFIKDQILICKIAECLIPLMERTPLSQEVITKHFESSPLLEEVKGMFKGDSQTYLKLFYEACLDVLNHKPCLGSLDKTLEGRIFTLKNALIAQHSPHVISKSQSQHGIKLYDLKDIQAEGAFFVREVLRIYLKTLTSVDSCSFKDRLTFTAEQLIPFVQKVTKSYLAENNKPHPENPLTFRNPEGYNHHGLAAAAVMEACLNALGYETRLLQRCDLEPRVTFATAHGIVEVTAPDYSKYIVDPSYIQFHKDIYSDENLFPKEPVLVLSEKEIESYIESKLMVHWKKQAEGVEQNNQKVISTIITHDQFLPFAMQDTSVFQKHISLSPESWVRKSLKRVWDIQTYRPVLANHGFQDIFYGDSKGQKTYQSIKAMGIASLCPYPAFAKIEERLEALMKQVSLKGQNSLESLSLIAQLPLAKRKLYAPLLDVDPRIQVIRPVLNAYFRSLKKEVNLKGEDKSVVYGCAGADALTVMLATDAQDFTFVDLTPVSCQEFKDALACINSDIMRERLLQTAQMRNFLGARFENGGTMSVYYENTHSMQDLPIKFFLDLMGAGVDMDTITITSILNEAGVQVDFMWQYHGALLPRKRRVTFLTGDITHPERYPALLNVKLQEGIDIFYMKAAFYAPQYYPQFLPYIAKSIKQGGWLMTADATCIMDVFNPEDCLKSHSLSFKLQKNKEIQQIEETMYSPFDPFSGIPLLKLFPQKEDRRNRNPGSDFMYWSILNLRKKIE